MQSGILGCSSKGETELPVKSDNAETRARARSLVCILMSKHVIIHYASPRMNSAGAAYALVVFQMEMSTTVMPERKVGLSVAFA